ncbi:MAG: hypothetical protein Q4G03_00060 [Planctomycetia bacterium]|nr:hypothetical protein [Planctomycetia bacterium]
MAIDLYALCPGGRGKKINYCCPDHVKDLEQIDKMLESEQYAAGLAFVDNLLKTNPDCACFTEAKCLFQRMIGLWEDAWQTASDFVKREPNNVVALTELATASALIQKPQEAVSALIDAVESVEGEQFPVAIVQAMLTVGLALYEQGRLYPAIAIAKQLQSYAPQDQASNAFLYRCLGSDSTPLMLREQAFDRYAPDDFPAKPQYDQAVDALARGKWKTGKQLLESILQYADLWPNLYRNLGVVELWFVNNQKGRDYLQKFIESEKTAYEDAVDVLQVLLLLESPTWDDVQMMTKRVYTLVDFDQALTQFLSAKNVIDNKRMLAAMQDEETPPRMAFSILDKPLCEKTQDLTLQDVSNQIGVAFLYGKQTKREARAEAYVTNEQVDALEKALQSILGAVPPLESVQDMEDLAVTWTINTATPKFQFKSTANITKENADALYDAAFDDFAQRWFEHPYRVLGNASPKSKLQEPRGAAQVDALLRVVVDLFNPPLNETLDQKLRKLANLPAPQVVETPEKFESNDDALDFFRAIPIWRWGRVQLQKLQTSALAQVIQIVNFVAPRSIKEKYANELLKRPVQDVSYDDRAIAYGIMIDEAILKPDLDLALERIAEASEYANSQGKSDAQWNVIEIMTRFRRQEFDKVRQLAQHVFANHQDDQNAIATLQQFFAQLNAQAQAYAQAAEAYRLQNGGLGAANPGGAAQATNFGAGIELGSQPSNGQGNSSGLWTPDSDSGSTSGGGSKLWTPD